MVLTVAFVWNERRRIDCCPLDCANPLRTVLKPVTSRPPSSSSPPPPPSSYVSLHRHQKRVFASGKSNLDALHVMVPNQSLSAASKRCDGPTQNTSTASRDHTTPSSGGGDLAWLFRRAELRSVGSRRKSRSLSRDRTRHGRKVKPLDDGISDHVTVDGCVDHSMRHVIVPSRLTSDVVVSVGLVGPHRNYSQC